VRAASPREGWCEGGKAAKGGSGGALMTDGEGKRRGRSHTAPRGGRKMGGGGLVRHTLELEGGNDAGPGAVAPGSMRAW
jgi:hypothetical protein